MFNIATKHLDPAPEYSVSVKQSYPSRPNNSRPSISETLPHQHSNLWSMTAQPWQTLPSISSSASTASHNFVLFVDGQLFKVLLTAILHHKSVRSNDGIRLSVQEKLMEVEHELRHQRRLRRHRQQPCYTQRGGGTELNYISLWECSTRYLLHPLVIKVVQIRGNRGRQTYDNRGRSMVEQCLLK